MSDMEELVVVDTTEEISDPVTEIPHVIKPSIHDRVVKQNEKVNNSLNPKLNLVKNAVKNQLTYDNNPYGILVCSRFKVRSDIEDIPNSTEKRCHFSVEGNEINIKFPLRGEDADEMRKIGARKVIDFIMGLDRVPARLSELMSVPNIPVKRINITPNEIISFGPNSTKKRHQRAKSKLKSYTVRSELVKAKLTPIINGSRDSRRPNMAKVITKLPGIGLEFIGIGSSQSLAKLSSLTKALNYAKTNKLGGFCQTAVSPLIKDPSPLLGQVYDQSEDSIDSIQYPGETEYFTEPLQDHIPVHSRLSPRILTPASNSVRYFEDPPLLNHYPPTDTVQHPLEAERTLYDPISEEHMINTYYDHPPEVDYTSYPISSNLPHEAYYKSRPVPIGPQMYLRRGGWRGAARARGRGRGRRSRFMSKYGQSQHY